LNWFYKIPLIAWPLSNGLPPNNKLMVFREKKRQTATLERA